MAHRSDGPANRGAPTELYELGGIRLGEYCDGIDKYRVLAIPGHNETGH